MSRARRPTFAPMRRCLILSRSTSGGRDDLRPSSTSATALARPARSRRPLHRLFEARDEAEAKLVCADKQEGLTLHDYCSGHSGLKTWA